MNLECRPSKNTFSDLKFQESLLGIAHLNNLSCWEFHEPHRQYYFSCPCFGCSLSSFESFLTHGRKSFANCGFTSRIELRLSCLVSHVHLSHLSSFSHQRLSMLFVIFLHSFRGPRVCTAGLMWRQKGIFTLSFVLAFSNFLQQWKRKSLSTNINLLH
jgi:hypothetical protein